MVLVYKRSSNMTDSPKKLSNGSMHFSYNLQEGRSPKNLNNSITPEASKNLNYRADKQNYITDLVMIFFRVKPNNANYKTKQILLQFSRNYCLFVMSFSPNLLNKKNHPNNFFWNNTK